MLFIANIWLTFPSRCCCTFISCETCAKEEQKTEKTKNKKQKTIKELKQGAKEKNGKMENYGLNIVFLRRMIRLLTSMMGETMAILFFILLFVFAIGYEVMTIDKERDSWRDIGA